MHTACSERTNPLAENPRRHYDVRVKHYSIITSTLLCVALLCGCGPKGVAIDVRDAAEAGDRDAPYQVVVYSDFQCPYCRMAAAAIKELVRKHPDRVHYYFKHFPLRQHPQSEKAAAAAEAARLQGKFWEMHDLIFQNAIALSDESYAEYAAMLGLDVEQFKRDAASEAVATRIATDRSEAEYLGLDGTPYFIVNGAPYTGSFVDLIQEIEAAK